MLTYVDHMDHEARSSYPVDRNFLHADVPLEDIVPHIPQSTIRKIFKIHDIVLGLHVRND